MDEPDRRVQIVEVLVLGLERQAVLDDRVDERVDLARLQRDVSVEQRPAVRERLERHVAVDLERRLDDDAVDVRAADVVPVERDRQHAAAHRALGVQGRFHPSDGQRALALASRVSRRQRRRGRDGGEHEGCQRRFRYRDAVWFQVHLQFSSEKGRELRLALVLPRIERTDGSDDDAGAGGADISGLVSGVTERRHVRLTCGVWPGSRPARSSCAREGERRGSGQRRCNDRGASPVDGWPVAGR